MASRPPTVFRTGAGAGRHHQACYWYLRRLKSLLAPRSRFREAMTGCASPVIHGDPCETRTQHYQLERLASSPIRRRGRMATPTGLEPAIS